MSAARALGLDTSNYTTSVAVFDGARGENAGRLLDVPEGGLGLRQSEALFQHVKRLPEMVQALGAEGQWKDISVVGASTRPRQAEGSYMPCFLAGQSQGITLAEVLGVPFFPCSHQQGHLAAAAWSAGRMDLLDRPHLAWHLSGGTTELVLVEPEGRSFSARRIGGTSDLAAGQLIDRTGKYLGLHFPSGKALDQLAGVVREAKGFPVQCRGLEFSLSGVENQVQDRVKKGCPPEEIANFVFSTLSEAVSRATARALEEYGPLPVLCSGGVASNRLLRREMEERHGALFAEPRYATDNALGVAILAWRSLG